MAQVERATVFGQNHGALDHVFEFAHVAWPVVVEEGIHRTFAEPRDVLVVLLGETLKKPVHHQRNVVAAVAQRRNVNRKHVQAEEQVFAKEPGFHGFPQIDVGCRHHSHIDLARARVTHALQFTLLEGAQQLALCRVTERADFVEKERAAVGPFEAAGA